MKILFFFYFAEALRSIAATAARDLERLDRGAALGLSRRPKWVLQDVNIANAQASLVLGRLTKIKILSRMAHRTLSSSVSSVDDDTIDGDLVALEDHLPNHAVPVIGKSV